MSITARLLCLMITGSVIAASESAQTHDSLPSGGFDVCRPSGQAIPDNDVVGITDEWMIDEPGEILDVYVGVEVSHTAVGDIILTLTNQDTGTSVILMDRPGFPATQFGCVNDNIAATFSDDSPTPVENVCEVDPAIWGFLKPQFPLDAFDGEDATGTWALTVSDNEALDSGTLEFWCLEFEVFLDSDLDDVADEVDNCIDQFNADQLDTDNDGFGNRCDGDLNNDCATNFLDLGIMRSVFFGSDPDADINGDGIVNFQDLAWLNGMFFVPPGPSAQATCTPP